MAQTPQTPSKKQRIQIKVFDVDSGQELTSTEHVIPVNGVLGVGGFCSYSCYSTYSSHGCVMVAPPPPPTQ